MNHTHTSTLDFKKYFVMKANDECKILNTADTIVANRELEKYFKGSPRKVTILKNGSLLVEVASRDKQVKSLNYSNVTVQKQSTFNYTKGTQGGGWMHYLFFCLTCGAVE